VTFVRYQMAGQRRVLLLSSFSLDFFCRSFDRFPHRPRINNCAMTDKMFLSFFSFSLQCAQRERGGGGETHVAFVCAAIISWLQKEIGIYLLFCLCCWASFFVYSLIYRQLTFSLVAFNLFFFFGRGGILFLKKLKDNATKKEMRPTLMLL
jgi:hypothetical protein